MVRPKAGNLAVGTLFAAFIAVAVVVSVATGWVVYGWIGEPVPGSDSPWWSWLGLTGWRSTVSMRYWDWAFSGPLPFLATCAMIGGLMWLVSKSGRR